MLGDLTHKVLEALTAWRRDRRREFRENVDAGAVTFGGRSYPVKNWSSTGFLAAPCKCSCRKGDTVDIHFRVEFPGKTVQFDSQAMLVRVDEARGEVAGVFTMMDRDSRRELANHFD